LDIRKVTISDFKFQIWVFENLEKSKRGQGPLVSRSCRLNGLCRSPVRARTVSGDVVVTAHCWWPPPHVVPALSPHHVEQRTVSPTSPSFPRTSATTVLCRSQSPRPHQRQPPSSAAQTRCCLPKLCLHPTVLIALTPGAIPPRAHRQPAVLAISQPCPCLR
jgi:hypothetical protein